MAIESPFNSFHSKVLLFGEHLVNLGGDALTIPYDSFRGNFQVAETADERLEQYFSFLIKENFEFLDLRKLESRPKLLFHSDIPEGYGCGSSGALVAATYDLFKLEQNFIHQELKKYFSLMESYFHGVSSGTDPLVSYLSKPIRFSTSGKIQILNQLNFKLQDYKLILVDSGHAREGKAYINWFMDRSSNVIFKKQLKEILIPSSQSCINYLLGDHLINFVSSFEAISHFQFEKMKKMIPEYMESAWKSGLDSNDYFLKICGAGGGGFFIALVKKDLEHLLYTKFKTYSLF